jgi:hypothetical protein
MLKGNLRCRSSTPRPGRCGEFSTAFDQGLLHATGFGLDAMSPVRAAASVTLPSFITQVRDDVLTRSEDVQAIFDAIPTQEKSLFWIENSTRRWDGYTYFARDPDRILGWFNRFTGSNP